MGLERSGEEKRGSHRKVDDAIEVRNANENKMEGATIQFWWLERRERYEVNDDY